MGLQHLRGPVRFQLEYFVSEVKRQSYQKSTIFDCQQCFYLFQSAVCFSGHRFVGPTLSSVWSLGSERSISPRVRCDRIYRALPHRQVLASGSRFRRSDWATKYDPISDSTLWCELDSGQANWWDLFHSLRYQCGGLDFDHSRVCHRVDSAVPSLLRRWVACVHTTNALQANSDGYCDWNRCRGLWVMG